MQFHTKGRIETIINSLETELNQLLQYYNLIEEPKEYVLEVEMPGYKKTDIDITVVDDSTLHVIAENKRPERKYLFSNLLYGRTSKKFNLPKDVDSTQLSAKLVDGILIITIPKISKSPNTGQRKININ